MHEQCLLLDDSERPTTVHELARLLLTWTDGPLPTQPEWQRLGFLDQDSFDRFEARRARLR